MTSPSLARRRSGECIAGAACALVLALVAPSGASFAQSRVADASPVPEVTSIGALQLIQTVARAADRRDLPTLEHLLHPAFRVVFKLVPDGPPTVLDRVQYLQMVREGKLADKASASPTQGVYGGSPARSTAALGQIGVELIIAGTVTEIQKFLGGN